MPGHAHRKSVPALIERLCLGFSVNLTVLNLVRRVRGSPMSLQARLNAVVQAKSVVQAEIEDDERRWARRKPSRLPAHIFSPSQRAPIPCVVLDGSSTGTQIELTAGRSGIAPYADMVPDTFLLVIEMHQTQVECSVAWRRGNKVGARYLGATKPFAPAARPSYKKK
jgi:hypothetical protein